MMGPYDPKEPLARFTEQLEKGREFAQAGCQTVAEAMMVSKGIIFLSPMAMFNEDIREWRHQTTDQNIWENHKIFFHQAHHEQRRAVTTAGKGGYTVAVKNIYGAPPLSPEKYNEAINNLHTIAQGMQE